MWALLGRVAIALDKYNLEKKHGRAAAVLQKDDWDAVHIKHLSFLFRKAVIITVPIW